MAASCGGDSGLVGDAAQAVAVAVADEPPGSEDGQEQEQAPPAAGSGEDGMCAAALAGLEALSVASEELGAGEEWYPAFEAASEAEQAQLPRFKAGVFPSLEEAMRQTDPATTEVSVSVVVFVRWFSVYKHFIEIENEGWFEQGIMTVRGLVRHLLDLGRQKLIRSDWLIHALKMVYIFARIYRAFLFFEGQSVYATLGEIARSYADDPDVLAGVMFALGNLTFQVESLTQLTLEHGLLELVLGCMEGHPDHAVLVESGMWVLANLFFSDHDCTDLIERSMRDITAAIQRFPDQTSLVCEGCYALYNLACLSKYHAHMYELGIISITARNLETLRTTQYFVPAMDLLRRLAGTPGADIGTRLAGKHLEALASVTRPGHVEKYLFGQISSFVPQASAMMDSLWEILDKHARLTQPEGDNNVRWVTVRRPPADESCVPSLVQLCASRIVNSRMVVEAQQLPVRLQQLLSTFATPCTKCGRLSARSPHVLANIETRPGTYHWLCGHNCYLATISDHGNAEADDGVGDELDGEDGDADWLEAEWDGSVGEQGEGDGPGVAGPG